MVDRVERDRALKGFLKQVKELKSLKAETASALAVKSQSSTEVSQSAGNDEERSPCLVSHERSDELLQKHLLQFQQWSQLQPQRHTQKQLQLERLEQYHEEIRKRGDTDKEKQQESKEEDQNESPVEPPAQASADCDERVQESLEEKIHLLNDADDSNLVMGDEAWNALNQTLEEEEAVTDKPSAKLWPPSPPDEPPRLFLLQDAASERHFPVDLCLPRPPPGLSSDFVLPLKSAKKASKQESNIGKERAKKTPKELTEESSLDVAKQLEDMTLTDSIAVPRYGPRAASAHKTKSDGDRKERKRVSFGGVEMKKHPVRKDLQHLQENSRRQRRKTPNNKRICSLGSRCSFDSNCPYLHPRRDLRNSLGNSDFYALRPLQTSASREDNRRLSWTPGLSASSGTKGLYQFRL